MKDFPNIPGYKILKVIGEGGMAVVYLGIQEKLDRKVAIKVLNSHLLKNKEVAKRFIKEAHTAAKLHHPNIVIIYDVGITDGIYYIVSEYLPGGSLRDRLKKHKKIPPEEAFNIVLKIADALDYAHSKGFIHRDVKPENIMFREDGTPVLVDFGIAKAIGHSTRLTKTGITIGTPHYMSPEQARGRPLDHRTDMYSLGVVLYEMLTGNVPYDAEDSVAIAIKHIQDPIPQLPPELSRYQIIIQKMMAKDPNQRPSNRKELEELIKLATSGAGVRVTPEKPQTVVGIPKTTNRKILGFGDFRNILIGILGILLLLLLGSLIYITSSHSRRVTSVKKEPTSENYSYSPPSGGGGGIPFKEESVQQAKRETVKTAEITPDTLKKKEEGLNDDKFWQMVKDSGSIPLIKLYLKKFPEGKHVNEAIMLMEQVFWDSVAKANNKSGYKQYLKLYPSGKHAALARQKLSMLTRKISHQQSEENFWKKEVVNSGSIDKYKEYLSKYPKGRHREEAIDSLEELIWKQAVSKNSVDYYQNYLKEFPNGKYKKQAEERIARLQKYRDLIAKYKKDPIFMNVIKKARRYYINKQGYLEAKLYNNTVVIYIPEGEFVMGSPIGIGDPDEHPDHRVRLSGYWISKFETTFSQYDRFCDETGRRKPDDEGWGRGTRPVINVSWFDAIDYCKWMRKKTGLPFNLPTEAQWEKAAKANTNSIYFWGNDSDSSCKYANIADEMIKKEYPLKKVVSCNDGFIYTAPVGIYSSNPYGIKDILGNVWEWVRDWYERNYYIRSPYKNPLGPSTGKYKVLRGGAWNSNVRQIRCSNRGKWEPDSKYNNLGFRIVISRGRLPNYKKFSFSDFNFKIKKFKRNNKKIEHKPKRVVSKEKRKKQPHLKKVYSIVDVDVPPKLIGNHLNSLYRDQITGSVNLMVLVTERGTVDSVRVVNFTSASLVPKTLAIVKNYKYSPAIKSGKPVKVWLPQTIKFIQDTSRAYELNQVNVPPRVIKTASPVVPSTIKSKNLQGRVYLKVLVNIDGLVDSVKLLRASDRIFVKPAIDAAKKYLFKPAIKNKKKVKCWIPIAIFFNPESVKDTNSHRNMTYQYYSVEEKPEVVKIVQPKFPTSLFGKIKNPKVFVKVLVNEKGTVDSVIVLKASDKVLIPPAIEAAKKYLFKPGKHNGEFVKVWVPIAISFVKN